MLVIEDRRVMVYKPLLSWGHGEDVLAVEVIVPSHRAGGDSSGSGSGHGELEWRVDSLSGGGSSALHP